MPDQEVRDEAANEEESDTQMRKAGVSADEDKVEPIYVVEYTDGDMKDFDAEQLRYGQELFHTVVLANEEGSNVSSGSDEEESYRPPKVGS